MDNNDRQSINSLVSDILVLAMRVNSETKVCTFVYYSGHVEWVEVEIHLDGNFRNDEPDNRIDYRIRLSDGKAKKELLYVIEKLTELLEGAEDE